jgi:hypothetical protein
VNPDSPEIRNDSQCFVLLSSGSILLDSLKEGVKENRLLPRLIICDRLLADC